MQNQQFRTPLIKTTWILGGVILLIASMGLTAQTETTSIFHILLFVIGLAIGIVFAMAVLTGIFFSAAAMADTSVARQLWGDFREKISI